MSKKSTKAMRINTFIAKQTSAPQPIYHQPARPSTPSQSTQLQAFQAHVVIPKASAHASEDVHVAVGLDPSPSSYHSPHMFDNSPYHSGQTQPSQRSLLPNIKLFQYSNFSNNSNSNSASTQLSSATNNSNSSVQSGCTVYSDASRHPPSQTHHTYHVYASPGPARPHTPSHSDTYSQLVQPVAYEMYHPYYPSHSQMAPQIPPAMPSFAHSISAQSCTHHIIPRSSTGNINLLELDAQVEDHKVVSCSSSKHRQYSLASQKSVVCEHKNECSQSKHVQAQAPSQNGGKSTKQTELEYFNHDIRAYNIWIACLTHHKDEVIFVCVLYPYLCGFFSDVVGSKRCPTQNDLQPVLKRHGAVVNVPMSAKAAEHANTFVCINKNNFLSFWKWFKECCQIIRDLRHLWDSSKDAATQSSSQHSGGGGGGLGLNFFCTRQACEHNLLQSEDGTFCLRLSATICGGMVLSYVDNNSKKCKHVILVRQENGMYQCNHKTLLLHHIIRNFVKLKFLYTPNRLIAKEKVF
eukprot:CAMPEP_0202703394 /NCGR_PEP_ID=MMETSP1385-20130828/16246_1 /ASSEMBLY_ACC=CAM_ASM_000861 /TAXON_ID=933848 /ORGANISM="Elphidium margaritaceum" /LENGTH=520 /DNA_ID=CAMNT_0049361247 /DNA_START=75 /DNA_END=1637 /DNA_ORIENTATION=+